LYSNAARDAEQSYEAGQNTMQWQLGQNGVKEALEFSRKLAEEEIRSIERIHNRTLKSFGYIGIAVGVIAAVLSFIGYKSLEGAAITVATERVQAVATEQVKDKLTAANIDKIVSEQVQTYSKTSTDDTVQKDLQTEPLASEIRNSATSAATRAAERFVSTKFADRHFTELQCHKFITAVEAYDDLNGYPVVIGHNAIEANARDFSEEIQACLPRTKLVFLTDGGTRINAPYVDGEAIFRDVKSPDSPALHLKAAFKAVGVDMKIVSGPAYNDPPRGQKSSLYIWIGAKNVH
jgi:hypothetical protein